MVRPKYSFSLFIDNEETEDVAEIAAQLNKKLAMESEEAMIVEALSMDAVETERVKAEKLARQQNQPDEEEEKVERDTKGSYKPNKRYIQKGHSTVCNGNGSAKGQSRPSSSHKSRTSVHSNANNGNIVENAVDANGASEKKAESKEERKARLETERTAKEWEAEQERRRKEREIEAKKMTLETYLKKKKALEDKTKKEVEVRTVTLDQDFENMHLIGKKKDLSIKQDAEKEKISKLKKKADKAKTINISEFQKSYGAKTSQGASNGGVVQSRGAFNAHLKNGVNSSGDGAFRKPIANNGNNRGRGGYQKEAPRRDGADKKPIYNRNNNGNNRNGQGGYQTAATNEPATKSVQLLAKSVPPPSINNEEQFPGLLKH